MNCVGTVTDIAGEATNNGGSAKFAVTVTLDRDLDMRTGMNVAAKFLLGTTDAACCLPVEALVEQGMKTLVYTGYDEKEECLTGPVEVTTGVSDGVLVEILSGLEAGATVYYEYTETIDE